MANTINGVSVFPVGTDLVSTPKKHFMSSHSESDRSGKPNACATNIAEPHGDVQPSAILTGQMPEKEGRMSDYERGSNAGNEASCGNDNDEHRSDEQQVHDAVKRALEAFKRENPEIDVIAFEKGNNAISCNVAISCEGVVHVNVDVLEKCFELDRDTIDDMTALQFFSNPVLDTIDAFPARVRLEGKDYWTFNDVKAWVINYRHACAVRVVSTDVSRALAIFDEWREEKQYPAWCWATIFGGSPNAES
jgi:hypothetical protein